MVATTNTAPAMNTPFLNVSHGKFWAYIIPRYFVWYAFFVAPAIKHASATKKVALKIQKSWLISKHKPVVEVSFGSLPTQVYVIKHGFENVFRLCKEKRKGHRNPSLYKFMTPDNYR